VRNKAHLRANQPIAAELTCPCHWLNSTQR